METEDLETQEVRHGTVDTDAWCAGWVAGWNAQAEIKERPWGHIMPTGRMKLETIDCYECLECHEPIRVMEGSTVHYCPNCGARVVTE